MPSGHTERHWKGKFCGAYEITEWAGVTKGQVAHWMNAGILPPTVDEPQMGHIWDFEEVKAVLSERGYPRVGPAVRIQPNPKKQVQAKKYEPHVSLKKHQPEVHHDDSPGDQAV